MNDKFTKNLESLRGPKTQKEFAKELGISLSYYLKLENGIRKPSRKIFEMLKRKFPEIDLNIFFGI